MIEETLGRTILRKILIVLAIATGMRIFAQNADRHGGPMVLRFEFEGLVKTELSVLEPYFRAYEGRPLSGFDEKRFIQDLRSLGIFHAIAVAKEMGPDGNVVVRVRIEEKWTLIPIPLGGMSGDNFYAGLMFLESNFLGYNKKLYGGGIFSNTGWKGLFGYVDPKFLGSNDTLFLGFNGERDRITNRDIDGNVYRRYEILGLRLSSEYGLRLSRSTFLGLGLEFQERKMENYESSLPPPDSVSLLSPVFAVRYQDLVYERILVNGTNAVVRYKKKFDLKAGDSPFDEISFVGQYRKPVTDGLRFGFLTAALFAPYTPVILEPEINKVMKSLPDGVAGDSYLFGQALVEYTFAEFGWGAFAVLVAYEVGLYNDKLLEPEYTNGPGLGFRIYVSKVAIPAFGLDSTYSPRTNTIYATINVGMQL